jgi:hypothetical protein
MPNSTTLTGTYGGWIGRPRRSLTRAVEDRSDGLHAYDTPALRTPLLLRAGGVLGRVGTVVRVVDEVEHRERRCGLSAHHDARAESGHAPNLSCEKTLFRCAAACTHTGWSLSP